jgi:5-methylcytosine-specific restriction endonuclease McrA
MYDIISPNVLNRNVPALLVTAGNVVNPVRRIGMFILTQKKCSKCGEVKSLSEFPKYKKSKDGLLARCRLCENKRAREYWNAHPEKEKERSNRWIFANLDKVRAKGRRWYAAHAEEENRKSREYIAAHPEKNIQYLSSRRARLLGNGGTITAQEWGGLKKKYNYTCLCCKRREPEIKLTLDHVLPLILGGENVIENAQPLCKSCNSRKHAKHIDYR